MDHNRTALYSPDWRAIRSDLVRLRRARSVTQADLARRLRVTQQAVSLWERGRWPGLMMAYRWASCLGMRHNRLTHAFNAKALRIRRWAG